jgi:hypothetical protein
MPAHKPLAILGAILVLGLPIAALQPAMTEEDYGKAMTEVQRLVGDANQHVDSDYWPDLQEDLQKLRARFNAVEKFWTARETPAAVGFAQSAIQAIKLVQAAADKEDGEAARTALRGLQRTCQSCHAQFREETADGFRMREPS